MTTATARPAFTATMASEWTKLTALRSTRITVALSIVLAVALSAITCIVIGVTWDDWKPEDRAGFEPAGDPLVGGLVSAILFAVLGVRAVAAEYASGMMRLTLTATPRRGRLLLAKVAVVTAITLAAGTIGFVAMFLTGQAIFGSYDLDTASLGSSDALRMVFGSSALGPVLPLIGVALATMLRSTAGAITTLLALIFLPAILGPLLPHFVEEHVLIYLPGAASEAITNTGDDQANQLSPGAAIPVTAAWVAIFLGAAYATLTRRDA
jgi:ABC-2 type transport system permease protein